MGVVMAEQLNLTQAITTTLWRVQALTLFRGLSSDVGGVVSSPAESRITVHLVGDNGARKSHTWFGTAADNDIIALNKANLSGAGGSLEKRILNRLVADGVIAGTVAGSPD